jgi:hypothetical protein
MHLISIALVLAGSAHVVAPPSSARAEALAQDKCANASSHLAGKPAVLRSDPSKPQKLTELPDAQTYAAVYRVVDGCAVPVLYRDRSVRPPKP